MPSYAGEVRAPDFPSGADWLNTERPLSMRDLRGKVVLLDFWTFCCINCMHVLADLKKLERKYASELAVVGVHCAKFAAERETENIRQAVMRYEIEHPVVNDPHMTMWRQYGVRAWPTVVLIDPEGKVMGGHSGEGIFEPFHEIIGKVIEAFDKEGKIDRRPLRVLLEGARASHTLLSFPGKVLADAAGRRLFIADSNHNRVIVASLEDGAVEDVIGEGELRNPQGMALDGEHLYIADTDQHAVRRAHLRSGQIETIAGSLNSPWDLVLHDGCLYIAMAGCHQIWKLDLLTRRLAVHAGSRREGHIDGLLGDAALAQPSGITTDGRKLFFADSEVSSIRAADIDPRGGVSTIVGQDLFDFGDIDGVGEVVRLQHPLGVVCVDGTLYVADTYNNKIKQIFPRTRSAITVAGSGRGGLRNGPAEHAEFDEPAGVTVADGKLYIADTNNHTIRVVDLRSRAVSTFELRQVRRLARWKAPVTVLEPQCLRGGQAELLLHLDLADGYKWNPEAPVEIVVMIDGGQPAHSSHRAGGSIRIPFALPPGKSRLHVGLVVYYCEAPRQGVCLFHEENLEVPLTADSSRSNTVLELRRAVGLPTIAGPTA